MTAPMAVRLDWGRLHLAVPTGRGYKAVCGRTLQMTDTGPDLVVYLGHDAGRAWRLETTCLDCERRLAKALRKRPRAGGPS